MPSILLQVVHFANVASGATVVQNHNINLNGRQVIPDFATPSIDNFTIAVTSTQISVTNNGLGSTSIDVLLQYVWSAARALSPGLTHLTPDPFIPSSGSRGGSAGNRQVFVRTCDGTETDTFPQALPANRPNTSYVAVASDGGAVDGFIRGPFTCLQYAVNQFTVKCAIAPAAGDKIIFVVQDLT